MLSLYGMVCLRVKIVFDYNNWFSGIFLNVIGFIFFCLLCIVSYKLSFLFKNMLYLLIFLIYKVIRFLKLENVKVYDFVYIKRFFFGVY